MDYVKKKRYNWGDNSKNGKHKHTCNTEYRLIKQLVVELPNKNKNTSLRSNVVEEKRHV